jgi:glycosyltransferase involved in cell wall biosynthesis
MRALLIHQAFASTGSAGGTRHFEFASRLAARGHSFTVVTSGRDPMTGEKARIDGLPEGLRLRTSYMYPALHRSFLWRMVSYLSFMVSSVLSALFAGKVDVVIGTSPPIFQALSAWMVSALRRRPFLLEIRDLWPEFAVDMGLLRNPVLIALSRRLERFLYARSDHILVNSPAFVDYLRTRGIPEKKVDLIPNGVDPEMFAPKSDGNGLREGLRIEGKFVVTYTGALGLANDIPTILRAADRLQGESRIHFLLVGDGMMRPRLESMSRGLGLKNVTFLGSRSKAEIPEILAASDAGVATLQDIPMFRTTYPNKVFDYMAAGRPTVLCIDGVIRQVVETGNAGVFVRPGDDRALARTVLSLSREPEKARAMGESGRAFVENHFHRSAHAAQFEDLLLRIVRRGRSNQRRNCDRTP